MNTCKSCPNEVTGRQVYCSDKCRMAFNRTNESEQQPEQSEQIKANTEPEQAQSEQSVTDQAQTGANQPETVTENSQKPRLERNTPAYKNLDEPEQSEQYVTVTGGKVYGRQEVKFASGQWLSRPEPLNPDDKPHTGGRGKYTRQDGSVYQFDSSGTAFEVVNGKVYQTIEEVKACYAQAGQAVSPSPQQGQAAHEGSTPRT